MDTELTISIVVAIGLPIVFGLVMILLGELTPKVGESAKKAKENIVNAIEIHKDKNTIEYQESLIKLIAAGYTEEQAKAMLKASKKIEQLKKRSK